MRSAAATLPPETARDRIGRAALYTIALYLIGKMFYVLGRGAAQPADVALALMALFVSPPWAVKRMVREWTIFALLVLWVLIVNTGWALITGKIAFMVSATYYIFNFLVVTAVFSTRERDPALFDRVIANALLVSIVIQFVAVVILGGVSGGRATGTFNNPNQLSYWALLTVSILLIVRQNRTRLWDLPFLMMALWCQVAGASRAGAVSILLLLAGWAWFALETPIKRVLGILIGAMVAALFVASPLVSEMMGNKQVSVVESRLSRKGEDSQLEIRNYTRITKFYQYTALGAGEGFLARFEENWGETTVEIHSSFGTMLFSYGVVGLTLFLLFIAGLFRKLPIGIGMYLVPALIYGFTHQGLRFTFFWMMLGIMMSLASAYRRGRPAAEAEQRAVQTVRRQGFGPRRGDFLLEIARNRGAQ